MGGGGNNNIPDETNLWSRARVPGMECWQKKCGSTTKRQKTRELATDWAVEGVEAHGQSMLIAIVRLPETKYKRSKIAFFVTSIVFTIAHICTDQLQIFAHSLIGSPGTLALTSYWDCAKRWSLRKKGKKQKLFLVADFAVITAQLWSTITAIFLWVNYFAFNNYLWPRF